MKSEYSYYLTTISVKTSSWITGKMDRAKGTRTWWVVCQKLSWELNLEMSVNTGPKISTKPIFQYYILLSVSTSKQTDTIFFLSLFSRFIYLFLLSERGAPREFLCHYLSRLSQPRPRHVHMTPSMPREVPGHEARTFRMWVCSCCTTTWLLSCTLLYWLSLVRASLNSYDPEISY